MNAKVNDMNVKVNDMNLKVNDLDWKIKMVLVKTTGLFFAGFAPAGSVLGVLGWNIHLILKPNEEIKISHAPNTSTKFFKFPPKAYFMQIILKKISKTVMK